MQSKNQNGSVQLSLRYWQYLFAKRHFRGQSGSQVFPFTECNAKSLEELTKNAQQGYRVYGENGIAPTQASQSGGVGAKTGLVCPTIHATQRKSGDNQTLVASNLEIGYNGLYVNATKTNSAKNMSSMRKTNNEDKKQTRRINESSPFQENEVLQSRMYEKRIQRDMENNETKLVSVSQESKASIYKIRNMRNLSKEKKYGNTSQGRGLEKQQITKSSGNMQELPQLYSSAKIRRLTPIETARLQGFPDDWHKVEGISDTQAYKVYGNAVTTNVIKAIMEKLII